MKRLDGRVALISGTAREGVVALVCPASGWWYR
jgi:hypothetical protein